MELLHGLSGLMAALFEVAAVDFDLLQVNGFSFERLLSCGPVHQSFIELFQRVDFKLIH